MNLLTLRDRLRRRIGNPSTDDVTNAVLNEIINTSYRTLTNRYRFHLGRKICTFLTSDGISRYGLPTDLVVLIRVRNNTAEERMIKYDSRKRYEEKGYTGDNIQKGVPLRYIRFRDWIEMIPIPDGIYEIELYYKLAIVDLAADGDVPTIPEAWHEGILKMAKYEYYANEQGDVPKSIAAQNEFDEWASRQPVEFDEEKIDFDSGVVIPTLARPLSRRDTFDTE